MMKRIPIHVLLSSEVRSQNTSEDKAAHVKELCVNLSLQTICSELSANYQHAYRRWNALKNGKEWNGVGRPPLIGYKDIEKLQCMVRSQFKRGDSADYTDVANCLDECYLNKIDKMSQEMREKVPQNLRKNYQYEVSKRFNFNVKNPQSIDKNRNQCATTETIHYFFNKVFTETMCHGVPSHLCFNADETSVEIGNPRKIIIPQGMKEGRKINKFNSSCHISAMITINAEGDEFVPYIIVP